MTMIFTVCGTTEVIQQVAKFLEKETTFSYKIENDSPDGGDMVITFDLSNQQEYVPYFMKWLHFDSRLLHEKIGFAVASRFHSILI